MPSLDEAGAAARRGVITAALRAQQPTRALDFADRYLAEPDVPEHLRQALTELRAKAMSAAPEVVTAFRPDARYQVLNLVA